ncbi:MAG: flippase-like domain-containing protein [Pirellulales bacterium]|nr:flippase-like domain-containing protein [Pirellulales bacterium]
MPASIRRNLVWLAKLAILAIVVWGGHRTIAKALADLRHNGWQLQQLQIGWAILSGALYLLSQLPCGWFWRGVLQGLGPRVAAFAALRAYFIGHLGKYVPGKAMVVVLRSGLIRGLSVKPVMAVVAVFYETFTTMACGAVLAAMLLVVMRHESTGLIFASLGLAAIVGLPTLPPAFSRLLRLTRIARTEPDLTAEPIRLSAKLLLRGWATIGVGWFFGGASLWAALRAIGVANAELFAMLPLCTAVTALAVVLGFVSMLPAGFGVREVVLLELLAPRLNEISPGNGDTAALIAVIVLRLIWFIAEVLASAILYGIKPAPPR